jgi:hypothetical protein
MEKKFNIQIFLRKKTLLKNQEGKTKNYEMKIERIVILKQ